MSLRTEVKAVPADYTSDIAFPVVPDVKANHASEMTEEEFQAVIVYIIEAERAFDTIADRERALREACGTTGE